MQDIYIKNIIKSYGDHPVLSDFSMEIPYGTSAVIMGPSGCGKTTLLRIMMGLEKPDGGSVEGMPKRYSTVFQEDRLCMDFTAQENIAMVLPRRQNGRKRKDGDADYRPYAVEIAEKIHAHMERVGLPGDSKLPVREYSGGMRRRVAIVRAVLADGDLLILDEPFQGLDPAARQQVMVYLKAEQRGRTLILVTHEKEEAQAMEAQIYHMDRSV